MTKTDPAFAAREFRDVIDRAIEQARQNRVAHYIIANALDQAASAVRMQYAATAPIL
jgi:hypothetical protein